MPRTHSPPGHELDFVISSKYTRTRAHTQQSFHKYLTAQTLSLRLSRSVRVSVSLCTRLEIAFCASARSRKDKWERKKKKTIHLMTTLINLSLVGACLFVVSESR